VHPSFSSVRAAAAALCCAVGLAACGGGGSNQADNPPPSAAISTFSAAYTAGVAALNSAAGLASAAFVDLFDTSFLDSSRTKTAISAALSAEAAAAQVSPDLPAFPQVAMSNVSLSDCAYVVDAIVCTMTATLTNSDVDTTAVTFTTKVRYTDKVRLLGDQSASDS
jgi:hypothetical protein